MLIIYNINAIDVNFIEEIYFHKLFLNCIQNVIFFVLIVLHKVCVIF